MIDWMTYKSFFLRWLCGDCAICACRNVIAQFVMRRCRIHQQRAGQCNISRRQVLTTIVSSMWLHQRMFLTVNRCVLLVVRSQPVEAASWVVRHSTLQKDTQHLMSLELIRHRGQYEQWYMTTITKTRQKATTWPSLRQMRQWRRKSVHTRLIMQLWVWQL